MDWFYELGDDNKSILALATIIAGTLIILAVTFCTMINRNEANQMTICLEHKMVWGSGTCWPQETLGVK